jgi:O-antigen/teichoic acid export membrane protein
LSLSTLADKYCPTICRPLLNRAQQSPIGKRIVSGTFWSVVGSGIGKVFMFVAMVFVARILGTQHYGELGLVRSVTDIFIGFSGFGLGVTATAYIAELLKHDKQRVGRIIGLCYLFTLLTCFLSAVILYFAAPLVCDSSMIHAPHLIGEWRISIIMLIFMTFMGTQDGVMSGFQDFRGLAFANFARGLLSIPLYICGAYYGGLSGAIIAMGVAALVSVIVNSIFIHYNTLKQKVEYDFRNVWRELSVLWKLSLPMFLCGIVYCIFTAIYRLMLAVSPNGFYELGIYVAAAQIEIMVNFIPVSLRVVLLSLLCESEGNGDAKRFQRIANLSRLLSIGMATVIVIPIMVFARQIMGCFGEEFADGGKVLLILCIGMIFYAGVRTVFNECIARNQVWTFLIITCLFHIVQLIILYYFLVNGYGALGMAYSYSIVQVFYFIVITKIKPNKSNLI